MARSRKAASNRALNYLRAAISHGRGRLALDQVRKQAPVSQYKTLVTCAYRVPNRSRFPLLAEFSSVPARLLSFAPLAEIPLAQELEWATCQLERHSTALKEFAYKKAALQLAVLQGSQSSAFAVLDSISDKFGRSDWVIQARLGLLQLYRGQDAQKSYAATVIAEESGLPKAIAHLVSQRNEDAVSFSGYVTRARENIEDWELIAPWSDYIKLAALGEMPATPEGIANLLRVAASGSPIDLYEAFETIAAASLRDQDDAEVVKRSIRRLRCSISTDKSDDVTAADDLFASSVKSARLGHCCEAGEGFLTRLTARLTSVLHRDSQALKSIAELVKL